MKKNLLSPISEETQNRNSIEADAKNSQNPHKENAPQNQSANSQWMPGSCRSSSPDNK